MKRGVLSILWKEMRLEYRQGGSILVMLLFLGLILLLFGFAFPVGITADGLAGIWWIAVLFSGILGLGRSFRGEIPGALLLAPVPREAIFWGKFGANLLFMLLVEIVGFPLFLAFYNFALPKNPGEIVLSLFLGTIGLAAVGTIVSALTAQLQGGEFLLPLLLFPLLAPDLVGGFQTTLAGLKGDTGSFWVWVKILAAYDVVFLILPGLLLEYVLEG